jgi:hypothetical protein
MENKTYKTKHESFTEVEIGDRFLTTYDDSVILKKIQIRNISGKPQMLFYFVFETERDNEFSRFLILNESLHLSSMLKVCPLRYKYITLKNKLNQL